MTTVGQALAGNTIPTMDGALEWAVDQDSSGGGTLTVVFTPTGGDRQARSWQLTPVGGLPEVPTVVTQGPQPEPVGSALSNPNTSQTGTASTGTLLDTGLGINLHLPI